MANREHLVLLEKSVEVWNQWRGEHPNIRPDLREADLRRVDLYWANLRTANLFKANLHGGRLGGADLSEAKLREADLSVAFLGEAKLREAHLYEADLRRAILINTDLSGADLRRTNLREVYLSEAEFSNARFGDTTLAAVDLRGAKGLEAAIHEGPSTIGIDTIYRSGGEIPEVFLRGAGVPDGFITFMRSLVGTAIEFYSCFISYSTKDQEFAERLYADLQANNVRCWFAPHDIQGGKKIHEQIDEAIRLHDKLLLILSPDSITSAWVETEIAKARKREVRDERRVLFPVRLADFDTLKNWECFDADTGKDSAREIREYFIPDFSDWKSHDSYQTAFQRLLKDLKAG
jgi:hypothetical protein